MMKTKHLIYYVHDDRRARVPLHVPGVEAV